MLKVLHGVGDGAEVPREDSDDAVAEPAGVDLDEAVEHSENRPR